MLNFQWIKKTFIFTKKSNAFIFKVYKMNVLFEKECIHMNTFIPNTGNLCNQDT